MSTTHSRFGRRVCILCDMPYPERTKSGKKYVQRSDCGNQSVLEHSSEVMNKPLIQFSRSLELKAWRGHVFVKKVIEPGSVWKKHMPVCLFFLWFYVGAGCFNAILYCIYVKYIVYIYIYCMLYVYSITKGLSPLEGNYPTTSVHTKVHMSKPLITFVLTVPVEVDC